LCVKGNKKKRRSQTASAIKGIRKRVDSELRKGNTKAVLRQGMERCLKSVGEGETKRVSRFSTAK
jgi:hypothetical protein